jgi:hypothetical protein
MNQFVHKILSELKTNPKLSTNSLVKMLAESTEKSITLGESENSIYNNLKIGLVSIYEAKKNPIIENLLIQFSKNEETVDSSVVKLAREINLSKTVSVLKESSAYSNPIFKSQVDNLEIALNEGILDFTVSQNVIKVFEQYSYDTKVKSELSRLSKYIESNRQKLSVLSTILQLESINSPMYEGVISNLKEMLVNETYTADILKLKYGSFPGVQGLINDLRLIESSQNGLFTLGEGNGDTRVNDLIAPSIKTKDGMVLYIDNQFLSIREAKGLIGNESKVHIDESFKIAEVDPSFVKSNYGKFYQLCEAYATLGFAKTSDGIGVETSNIKNLKLGFKVNEKKELDFYLNDTLVESKETLNVSEALALQPSAVQAKIDIILKESNNFYNFEFIKEVTNDRTLSEALVLKLNNNYFVCEKLNAADRSWIKVDEYKLYEFFASKFNYDISPIFKTKIDESIQFKNNIESKKKDILLNIEKLEEAIGKLDAASSDPSLDASEISHFSQIKNSIVESIEKFKLEYTELDLLKKRDLV